MCHAAQVVALSRLVYRKGIDLMALVIPYICSMHPNVDFVIGKYGGYNSLHQHSLSFHHTFDIGMDAL